MQSQSRLIFVKNILEFLLVEVRFRFKLGKQQVESLSYLDDD